MIHLGQEVFQAAIEATRGTAIANPTHLIPITSAGTLDPIQSIYEPNEQRGIWTKNFRHAITRNWAAFSIDPVADTGTMPFLLNLVVEPNTTPSTPATADVTRLWEFEVNQAADDIETATVWWGDASEQTYRSAFGVLESLTFANDSTGEDGATVSLSGHGNFPTKVAAPTPATAITDGSLIVPMAMQVWLDTGSDAIGTTLVSDRVISVTHEIGTGVSSGELKFIPDGAGSELDFTNFGRNAENIRLTTTITMELPDMTQYDLFTASTPVKLRVRHNGSLIETTFYNYVEFDTYGPLRDLSWGEHANSNRVVEFTVMSQYDATLAGGFRVAVQNQRTAL